MNRVIKPMIPFLCLAGLALMGLDIWVKYPSNHGSGVMGYVYFFSFLLLSAVAWCSFKRQSSFPVIILPIACLLILWFADRQNIMVGYVKWIERGMPEWGESAGTIIHDADSIELDKDMLDYYRVGEALRGYLLASQDSEIVLLAEGVKDFNIELAGGVVTIHGWEYDRNKQVLFKHVSLDKKSGYDYVAHVESGDGGWEVVKVERLDALR